MSRWLGARLPPISDPFRCLYLRSGPLTNSREKGIRTPDRPAPLLHFEGGAWRNQSRPAPNLHRIPFAAPATDEIAPDHARDHLGRTRALRTAQIVADGDILGNVEASRRDSGRYFLIRIVTAANATHRVAHRQ